MSRVLRTGLLLLLSIVLHATLGWPWTAVAAFLAGAWLRTWMVGAVVVGLDYAILVGYSFITDARAVGRMAETMGGFLGNMPSWAVVAVTLLIGTFLGGLSAAAGAQLRVAWNRRPSSAATA